MLQTQEDSLSDLINEAFIRWDVGNAVSNVLTFMRCQHQWYETTNDTLFLITLPKYLYKENQEAIDKFISKNVKKDLMSGEFVVAYLFLKNWLGLNPNGARNVLQEILVTTFTPKENEDVTKAYLAKKNLVDPYFNRLENSMFGRQLNQATLQALNAQGYRNEKAADEMMNIFRLIDMRGLKPTSAPIMKLMTHLTRKRIPYEEAVIIDSGTGTIKFDRKAARAILPPAVQQKVDKAAAVGKKLKNI